MPNSLTQALQAAFTHGERLRLIPIARLETIREELREFEGLEDLNGFQRWLVRERFDLEKPEAEFTVRSIVLVAIPHPAYASVALAWRGRVYETLSLVRSDFDGTEGALAASLGRLGFQMRNAPDLPLKRLAARSGLAAYGRNNVCYIDGIGSQFSLAAYYTDVPGEDDGWAELLTPAACERCKACLRSCPTGAIREGRFLIDNERCLSYLNESANAFPDWLPASAHHTLYDCLKCQLRCPLNKDSGKILGRPIRFEEAETEALLAGVRFADYTPALAVKAKYLGMDEWPDGIAQNLRTLIELSEGDR